MTQGELFERIIRNIKPSDWERNTAREYRDQVLEALNDQNLGITGVRNCGSFAKRTDISPLSDLDIVVFISPERYTKTNPKSILRILARDLGSSFNYNEVISGNRSVKVKFDDDFIIDIVPAFSINPKELEPAEILDRQTGKWIETSPSKHIKFSTSIKKIDRRYKDLVRVFKVWKRERRRNFRSIVVEFLIADAICNGAVARGWAEAVHSIFKYVNDHQLKKRIYFTNYYSKPGKIPRNPVVILDPVNPNNNVANDFTDVSRREFMSKWSEDTRLAYKALNSEYEDDAIEIWERVFGSSIFDYY